MAIVQVPALSDTQRLTPRSATDPARAVVTATSSWYRAGCLLVSQLLTGVNARLRAVQLRLPEAGFPVGVDHGVSLRPWACQGRHHVATLPPIFTGWQGTRVNLALTEIKTYVNRIVTWPERLRWWDVLKWSPEQLQDKLSALKKPE